MRIPAIPMRTRPLGSGTVLTGATLVCGEKLVTVAVPSGLTPTVAPNPSITSVVSTGMVPAASENMLNPKVLPDAEVPSGEFTAGPNSLTSNFMLEPKVNPSK
jgi:hypothetical protein